jgi:hypothetical protein
MSDFKNSICNEGMTYALNLSFRYIKRYSMQIKDSKECSIHYCFVARGIYNLIFK